jgi:hypothetical protein
MKKIILSAIFGLAMVLGQMTWATDCSVCKKQENGKYCYTQSYTLPFRQDVKTSNHCFYTEVLCNNAKSAMTSCH